MRPLDEPIPSTEKLYRWVSADDVNGTIDGVGCMVVIGAAVGAWIIALWLSFGVSDIADAIDRNTAAQCPPPMATTP